MLGNGIKTERPEPRHRRPVHRCPGDAPLVSVGPAEESRILLVFSKDGKRLVACLICGRIPDRTRQMCRALGGGTWESCPDLARLWEVTEVLAPEDWTSIMFIASAPRPWGVRISFES